MEKTVSSRLGHPNQPLLESLIIAGGLAVAIYGVWFAVLGMKVPALIEGAYVLVLAASYAWLRLRKKGTVFVTWLHIFSVVLVCGGITAAFGGLEGSAGFMVWGLVSPLAALVFLGPWPTVLSVLLYGAQAFIVVHFDLRIGPAEPLSDSLRGWFVAANIIGSSVLCLVALGYFLRQLRREQLHRSRALEETLRAQKMESLGTLAGGIAHDFSNILTALSGNLVLGRQSLAADHPIQARFELMDGALARASTLTRQLATISRGYLPAQDTVVIDRLVWDTASFTVQGTQTEAVLDVAGDPQPGPQRHPGHAEGRLPADPVCEPRVGDLRRDGPGSLPAPRAPRGLRRGRRHPGSHRGPDLRPLFHHARGRHGPWPGDLRVHRPAAPRPHHRPHRPRSRNHVPRLSPRRAGCKD